MSGWSSEKFHRTVCFSFRSAASSHTRTHTRSRPHSAHFLSMSRTEKGSGADHLAAKGGRNISRRNIAFKLASPTLDWSAPGAPTNQVGIDHEETGPLEEVTRQTCRLLGRVRRREQLHRRHKPLSRKAGQSFNASCPSVFFRSCAHVRASLQRASTKKRQHHERETVGEPVRIGLPGCSG